MNSCIFCKIIRGEIPCAKLYEDNEVLSFLDIAPNNKGHALVIPKKHSENLLEMDKEEITSVFAAAEKISRAINKAFNCDFNIVMNNGKNASQAVFHSHVHVIPRYEDDGIKFQIKHEAYGNDEMNKYTEKIKKCLDG